MAAQQGMEWLGVAQDALSWNLQWMLWNTFLAVIPFGLSLVLFRQGRGRWLASTKRGSLLWWLGVAVFVAFLPNAPYVLTDVIHLIDDIRRESSIWLLTLVLMPQYLVFMLIGFEAYVLSLINVGQDLKAHGQSRWVTLVELFLHALSAVGVYLGRFERFNSWDFVTHPYTVLERTIDNLATKQSLMLITITVLVIMGLYWPLKQITVALLLQRQYAQEIGTQGIGTPRIVPKQVSE